MPHLAIIPAAAVSDDALTDGQVRILCAIGTFTNKLGGSCWASVRTLAKQCRMTERGIQKALPVLIERGYLRRVERPGQTNLYEVLLDGGVNPGSGVGVNGGSGGGEPPFGGGVNGGSPKRPRQNDANKKKEAESALNAAAQRVTKAIWDIYPLRLEPHPFIPAMRAIRELLAQQIPESRLIEAAAAYADETRRKQTDPKYIRTMVRFYSDGWWAQYKPTVRVYGRTRDEWARSGQDLAEFDRLALTPPTDG